MSAAVARAVAAGLVERGIVIGASGQGGQIAASKVRGVRAALCNDLHMARVSRAMYDADVLAMGASIVGFSQATDIARTWLSTACEAVEPAQLAARFESPPAWSPGPSRQSATFAGTIRPMIRDDLPSVIDIVAANDSALRTTAGDEIGAGFPHSPAMAPVGSYLVAELDGEVIGVVGWVPDHFQVPDIRWLVWGYVNPGYQRRGVGAALFAAAEEELARLGIRKIYLDVGNATSNESAIAFHVKRGYAQEGTLRDFWADGEDLLVFGKHLGSRPSQT